MLGRLSPTLGRRSAGVLVAATLAAGAPSLVLAQDAHLDVALGGAILSMDPHYSIVVSNQMVSDNFFDGLTDRDDSFRAVPALAVSWEATGPVEWIFNLRPDVTYSDGTPLVAKDVVDSIDRATNLPNSPSSFKTYTNSIETVEALDDQTVKITTVRPNPLLPVELANVMIVPNKLYSAETGTFNSGEAMIGTGPYMLDSYTPGGDVTMTRNPNYWGEAPEWDTVTMSVISNDASRTAGLLSGDYDLIDQVAVSDVERLESTDGLKVKMIPSNRVIFLMLDHYSDTNPYISGPDGAPLDVNPLKDLRVRQALSMSINRAGITDRILRGQGTPAAQFLPASYPGTSDSLDATPYDPEAAKALLAEAGYPDGFQMTIIGSNDRYTNDSEVLQAIAQMFSRIGVKTQADPSPWATFRPKVTNSDFAMSLFGWASNTGEAGMSMRALIGTPDAELGRGGPNGGRYSNGQVDALVEMAIVTIDNETRSAALAQVTKLAMNDVAIIPLYFTAITWAMRDDLDYLGKADQFTTAQSVVRVD
ncbi:ABC transporter substrate-binding protein [Marinovum sp.]|uniref:ABC transporter substrate-binding protein n=1 Tax=Marinovum sp. TaxID=2024839 RepID=UPI002B26C851|nr:ABC transporter substrate-binding protein [Marinovum sp.]